MPRERQKCRDKPQHLATHSNKCKDDPLQRKTPGKHVLEGSRFHVCASYQAGQSPAVSSSTPEKVTAMIAPSFCIIFHAEADAKVKTASSSKALQKKAACGFMKSPSNQKDTEWYLIEIFCFQTLQSKIGSKRLGFGVVWAYLEKIQQNSQSLSTQSPKDSIRPKHKDRGRRTFVPDKPLIAGKPDAFSILAAVGIQQ